MNNQSTLTHEPEISGVSAPRRPSGFPLGLAVAALIALNSLLALRWIHADTRPSAWDEAIHVLNTFEYKDRVHAGSIYDIVKPAYFHYPPLFNLTAIPFLGRTADINDIGGVVNIFYLAALVWFTYLTGRFLLDRWAGLAAALLIGSYPLVVQVAHGTMLDIALTAWVTAAFFCLLKSESFSRVGWSAAFGFCLGLGMLTKQTAFAYLIGPALPALFISLRRKTFFGPFLAALVAAALMAPWYTVNFVAMLAHISQVASNPPASGLLFTGMAKLLWYPIGLFDQVNLPYVVLFLIGLPFVFLRRALWPLALMYFVSSAIFTSLHNQNVRYMMPALPAVALISAAWIPGRRWAFGFVAAVALTFMAVFNFSALSPVIAHADGVPLTLFRREPPLVEDWKHAEILARVAETRDPDAAFSRVVVACNTPYFHSTSLNVELRNAGIENFSFVGPSQNRWLDFAEFVLVKSGDLGPAYTTATVKKHRDWLDAAPAWFGKAYKVVGQWPLPDGSQATLYHANPDPVSVPKDEMMSVNLKEVQLPGVLLHDVAIRAVTQSPDDTAHGRLASLTARASSVDYRGLQVENAEVDLIRPQINLPRYREEGELQILALDRLSVKGTIRSETLLALAGQKARWLSNPSALFNDDVIVLAGRLGGKVPVRVEVRLDDDGEVLQPRLQAVSIGGVPVPVVFVRALTDLTVPLSPNCDWPYRIDLGHIRGSGDTLKVGS